MSTAGSSVEGQRKYISKIVGYSILFFLAVEIFVLSNAPRQLEIMRDDKISRFRSGAFRAGKSTMLARDSWKKLSIQAEDYPSIDNIRILK